MDAHRRRNRGWFSLFKKKSYPKQGNEDIYYQTKPFFRKFAFRQITYINRDIAL